MFGRGKKPAQVPFERGDQIPVIRSSICTGEQVAGFRDPASGKFREVMLIRDDRDLRDFLARYQVEESELRREW